MSDRVVGLDIGASSVKAAQVLRNGDGTYVVEKQAARPLPRGAVFDGRVDESEHGRVAAEIKALWAEAGFDTKDVILGFNSSSAVFMREMTVPLMKPEDIAKALPEIIVAREPNLDAEHTEFSYTVVGEQEGQHGPELKVLVYSVRADYAEQAARLAEAAELNVVGADLNALAVLRAMQVYDRPANMLDAILDVGANVTMLMLHHNGVPKMMTLDPDSAGNVATDKIAEALGITEQDVAQAEWEKINNQEPVGVVTQARAEYGRNLASKVAGGFANYLNHSEDFESLANVTLVGGGALLNGLGFYLRNALGEVPLSYAQIADNIVSSNGGEVERNEIGSGGDYLVAVGLGTGARL